jgi:uncharacterized phiE125 gp8 family phage protein
MIVGFPIRAVAPSMLPVSVVELKAQARIDMDDEDSVLASYLHAAVELAEEYTGLALLTQTWEQRFSRFGAEMKLYRRPVQMVGSPSLPAVTIQYLNGEDALQTLPDIMFTVSGVGSDKVPAIVRPGQAWPVTQTHAEAVRITYTAGFGDLPSAVPPLIRHAIYMAAATWCDYRADVVLGSAVTYDLPWASKALLDNWRMLAWA